MQLFVLGTIVGVLLSLLPTIGGAIAGALSKRRRARLDAAVEAEMARRARVLIETDPFLNGWDESRTFRPITHP